MTAKPTTCDILSRARTEAQAVEMMVGAGRPRADAEEVAAIAFGSSKGDIPAKVDRRGWGSLLAAAQAAK